MKLNYFTATLFYWVLFVVGNLLYAGTNALVFYTLTFKIGISGVLILWLYIYFRDNYEN